MGDGADPILILSAIALLGGVIGSLALTLWAWQLPRGEQAPLSLAILAAGVTCFGGAGILTDQLFEFDPPKSVLSALLFALLSAALFGLLARFARRIAERRAALDDLVGGLAAVVVAITPGRIGAVATRTASPELTVAAVSRHGQSIPVGTTVVVTATRAGRGDTVEVVPLPSGDPGFSDAAS